MECVTGIGGFFFRSKNPEELAMWYEQHLGVNLVPDNYVDQPWVQQPGPTVFAPFKKGTQYFGKRSQMWMLNFRVRDLVAMVKQLRDANIKVEIYTGDYPNGKFARLEDPEGNPIELWETQ